MQVAEKTINKFLDEVVSVAFIQQLEHFRFATLAVQVASPT